MTFFDFGQVSSKKCFDGSKLSLLYCIRICYHSNSKLPKLTLMLVPVQIIYQKLPYYSSLTLFLHITYYFPH